MRNEHVHAWEAVDFERFGWWGVAICVHCPLETIDPGTMTQCRLGPPPYSGTDRKAL